MEELKLYDTVYYKGSFRSAMVTQISRDKRIVILCENGTLTYTYRNNISHNGYMWTLIK